MRKILFLISLLFLLVNSEVYSKSFQKLKKPNSKAPKELSQFQFLVGKWKCHGYTKGENGKKIEWDSYWEGYYSLNGFAFVDDFTTLDSNGDFSFIGTAYRIYDENEKKWKIQFLDALKQKWIQIEGKMIDGEMCLNSFGTDNKGKDFISKIFFTDITKNSFTWRYDISYDNGKTWIKKKLLIKAQRK